MSTNSSTPVGRPTTTYSADYERGLAAGIASMRPEIDRLSHIADYWYFRANNPGVKTADEKIVEATLYMMDVREAREAERRKWVELDAIEELAFNYARELITTTDKSDIQIAVEVGIFAPTVATMRKEMGL